MEQQVSASVQDVLEKVALLALEDWGMCMVEQVEDDPKSRLESGEPMFLASMSFKGVLEGSLSILCEKAFMDNLCCNLLGLDFDEEVSLADSEDALKELTNVVSGNFLTEAYGEDTVFELVYPVSKTVDEAAIDWFFSSRVVKAYDADDQFVAIALGTSNVIE